MEPTGPMNKAQKMRKTARGYKPPRTPHYRRDLEEKIKLNSAKRKCLKQIKADARLGKTQSLVLNFKWGDNGRIWYKELFDLKYMQQVAKILKEEGFETSDVYVINKIPRKWTSRNNILPHDFDRVACLYDAYMLVCMVVTF